MRLPPNVHTNDPRSSAEAAARHAPKRVTNAARVLDGVRRFPLRTGAELAALLEMDVVECRRRLSDLHAKHLVARDDVRTCTVAGTSAVTWRLPAGQDSVQERLWR